MFGLGKIATDIASPVGGPFRKKREDEEQKPGSVANFGVVKEPTPIFAQLKGVASDNPQPTKPLPVQSQQPKFMQDSKLQLMKTNQPTATPQPVTKTAPTVAKPLGLSTFAKSDELDMSTPKTFPQKMVQSQRNQNIFDDMASDKIKNTIGTINSRTDNQVDASNVNNERVNQRLAELNSLVKPKGTGLFGTISDVDKQNARNDAVSEYMRKNMSDSGWNDDNARVALDIFQGNTRTAVDEARKRQQNSFASNIANNEILSGVSRALGSDAETDAAQKNRMRIRSQVDQILASRPDGASTTIGQGVVVSVPRASARGENANALATMSLAEAVNEFRNETDGMRKAALGRWVEDQVKSLEDAVANGTARNNDFANLKKYQLLQQAYAGENFAAPIRAIQSGGQLVNAFAETGADIVGSGKDMFSLDSNAGTKKAVADYQSPIANNLSAAVKSGKIDAETAQRLLDENIPKGLANVGVFRIDEDGNLSIKGNDELNSSGAAKALREGGIALSFTNPILGGTALTAGDVVEDGRVNLLDLALNYAGSGLIRKGAQGATNALEGIAPASVERARNLTAGLRDGFRELNASRPLRVADEGAEVLAPATKAAESVLPKTAKELEQALPTNVVNDVPIETPSAPISQPIEPINVVPRTFKDASDVVAQNTDEAIATARATADANPDVAQVAREQAAATDLTPQVENRPAEELQIAAANNSPGGVAVPEASAIRTVEMVQPNTTAQVQAGAPAASAGDTTSQIAAERFAKTATSGITDNDLKQALFETLSKNKKAGVRIQDIDDAFARIAGISDDELMQGLRNGEFRIGSSAIDMPENIALMRRLQVGTPTQEKMEQLAKVLSAMQGGSSESGTILRLKQEAYKYLPPKFKAQKMIRDIESKAPKNITEGATEGEIDILTQRIANADISANSLSKVDNSSYNIKRALETGSNPSVEDFSSIVDAAVEHNTHLSTLADSARVKAASAATRSERAAWQREAKYLENRLNKNNAVIDRLKGVSSINNRSIADIANIRNSISRQAKADVYDTAKVLKGISDRIGIKGSEWYRQISDSLGDVQRTAMLSSLTGRVRDLALTTANRGIIGASRLQSGIAGSIYNKLPNRSIQAETVGVGGGRLARGNVAARITRKAQGQEALDVLQGRYVGGGPEELGNVSKALRDSRVGTGAKRLPSRVVSFMTQLAPVSSAGAKGRQIARTAEAEAARAGLKGEMAERFVQSSILAPSDAAKLRSSQLFDKINLTDNGWGAKGAEYVSNLFEKIPIVGGMIRNSTIPFGRILGNGIEQAVTDRNILYNAGKIVQEARRGNPQAVIDQIGNLATNAEMIGAAYLLWNSGLITTEDVNGDKYSGVYLKLGNNKTFDLSNLPQTSMIAAFAGMMSAALGDGGVSPTTATLNAVKQVGLSDPLGGQSPIASNLKNVFDASIYGNEETADNALAKAGIQIAGNTARQFIPAIGGDINSSINSVAGRNAPQTKATRKELVTNKNGTQSTKVKTDVLGTEVNRTLAALPGIQQATLPERADRTNRSLIDRSLGTTRGVEGGVKEENDKAVDTSGKSGFGNWYQIAKINDKKSGDQIGQKIQRNDGETAAYSGKIANSLMDDPNAINRMAVTKDELQSYKEDDKYADVLGYYDAVYRNTQALGESKKKVEAARLDYARAKVNSENQVPYRVQELYRTTSNSEWRAMGNPESDSYDPDTYKMLAEYDKLLTGAGASRNDKSFNDLKYTSKGSSGRAKKMPTTIGTLGDESGGARTKQTARKITESAPELKFSVPQKSSAADQIKTKTIKVQKGALA